MHSWLQSEGKWLGNGPQFVLLVKLMARGELFPCIFGSIHITLHISKYVALCSVFVVLVF